MEYQVNLGVKRIKEIEFFIDEHINLSNPENSNIKFEITINLNAPENVVELLLTTLFADSDSGQVFMKIKTSNLFTFLELDSFKKADSTEYNLPDNVLVTFLSLSISHSRALLAKNTLGTKFADLYIPIVNPTDVLKQLFSN